MLFRLLPVLCVIVAAARGFAQDSADWIIPFPAHRVVANIHYVGSQGLASYLLATPEGHILINSSLETSIPLIQRSVEELGFRFSDIKILLISHAHWDHCAGSAAIKKLTGARYMVMEADVPDVESGGRRNFHYARLPLSYYPPTKVDRVLHDGDKVTLGNTVLVARHTPGHTKGTTTWTLTAEENGRTLQVVVVGSPNVNAGYRLVGNTEYPTIADDYEKTFRILKSLPCDVFLGAHGSYYGMEQKVARLKTAPTNPFIDPDGYTKYITQREEAFRAEKASQQAAANR